MAANVKAPTAGTVRYVKTVGALIGEGAYRKVFKTKRGKWVVKEDKCPTANNGTNSHEYETYLKLRKSDLPEGVKLPEMHLINGHIVAEFIDGHHPASSCTGDWHSSYCEDPKTCYSNRFLGWNVQVRDLHTENMLIGKDGNVYLIDIGFGLIGE